MSSMTFGQKTFSPKPPDKGSFPLDHAGDCKQGVLKYLLCLKEHDNDAESCRHLAQDYLKCRMDNQLMAKEEWSKLGFQEPRSN
ncbi:hypothetical protein HPB47_026504 [Ixodes persulcatus]|uniref:Uncharacterized protein n=1 Tax=Ixodes persulcatus TaxID=34615 RepID=A0AC60PYH6_IXOPE|nr:hypothetical protein HPB47_026504 [Ixodes persulcatus]